MKKLLLVVAILLIASPVMATVSVTATDKGSGVVEVRYNCSAAEKVRSFALDLSVDSGLTIDNIRDFNTGESKKPGGGYGIFPGRFADYINPASPNWADANYKPVAPVADPNARTGLGTGAITVEMGSLYVDVNAPGTAGLLFRLDINPHGASDANLSIVLNNTRVGVVLEDTNVVASPVLTGTKVSFGCTVPNVAGLTRAAAVAALSSFVIGTDVNVPGDGIMAVGNVYAQNPAPGTAVCGSTVILSVVSYPIKDTAPASLYVNWVNRGKPQCWAYPRQCRGDADGKKQVSFWVGSNDLTILRGAISKLETAIPLGGICADLDHKKQVSFWVGSNDLNILRAYISKLESLVPICGNTSTTADPNYWYWCVPTGVTCPAGQTCAPAGVCPNTP